MAKEVSKPSASSCNHSYSHNEVTVYIGSSASLAFLQFIRDAVSTSTSGNSRFEQDPSVKVMLEVAQPLQCNLGPDGSLDASTKSQYGCDFRITVSDGLIHTHVIAELTTGCERQGA
jgi:hypothetical protein